MRDGYNVRQHCSYKATRLIRDLIMMMMMMMAVSLIVTKNDLNRGYIGSDFNSANYYCAK